LLAEYFRSTVIQLNIRHLYNSVASDLRLR